MTLRCRKGGMTFSSGDGGLTHTTTGNIEYPLDTDGEYDELTHDTRMTFDYTDDMLDD